MRARNRRTRTIGPTAVRANGLSTRKELLEAAGSVFAEHGYAAATIREICRRARANDAAVSYHFGGKYGLYEAVVEVARDRVLKNGDPQAAALNEAVPSAWLRMLLARIVTGIARRDRGSWELRVLVREVMSSSPLLETLVDDCIAPNASLTRAMLAETMGLPIDHPAVNQSIVSIMGPCVFLLLLTENTDLRQKVAPHLELDQDDLVQHVLTFVFAGLRAVANQAARPREAAAAELDAS